MMVRGAKNRRALDQGFVLSDHADWTGLNHVIRETGAEKSICHPRIYERLQPVVERK
jgi:hypothetical protein